MINKHFTQHTLSHSLKNNLLNQISDIDFSLTPSATIQNNSEIICLMNMTFLEQKTAWSSLRVLYGSIKTLITSGILVEQKDKYIEWMDSIGFTLKKELQRDKWLGFAFDK